MSDELELEPQDVGATPETEVGEGAPTSDEDRQPEEGQVDWSKVNLDDSPQFRKWKSETDKRLQAAEERERKYQEQVRQYEQQMHEARMAQMTAEERYQYEWQQYQEGLQSQQRQIEMERANVEFVRQVMAVSMETGVPLSELDQSTSISDAWRRAFKHQQENPPKRQRRSRSAEGQGDDDDGEEATPASQPGNRVDTGQGQKPSRAADLRKRLQAAEEDFDADMIMQLHQEAAERGVQL